MEPLAWVNGVIVNLKEAKVSLEDRGYLFGDGVYEVIRVYRRCLFYFAAHLKRLQESANAIGISLPRRAEEIEEAALSLLSKSGYQDAYIYIQVTRGIAERSHLFSSEASAQMVLFVREHPPLVPLKEIKPVKAVTLPDERWLNCHIKTINLLPNILALQKAAEAGADEALLYRAGGMVTEGTKANVFAVINGIIRTHPATNLILSGVSRKVAVDLAKALSLPVKEEAFSLSELKEATEAWLTSTMQEVCPLESVDGHKFAAAPGPFSTLLMQGFRQEIKRVCGGV